MFLDHRLGDVAEQYEIVFPDYFDGDAAVIESKGYFSDLSIKVGESVFRPAFYDETRLAQTVTDDLTSDGHFAVRNLVVVPRVTRERIEDAVRKLSRNGFAELASE